MANSVKPTVPPRLLPPRFVPSCQLIFITAETQDVTSSLSVARPLCNRRENWLTTKRNTPLEQWLLLKLLKHTQTRSSGSQIHSAIWLCNRPLESQSSFNPLVRDNRVNMSQMLVFYRINDTIVNDDDSADWLQLRHQLVGFQSFELGWH